MGFDEGVVSADANKSATFALGFHIISYSPVASAEL